MNNSKLKNQRQKSLIEEIKRKILTRNLRPYLLNLSKIDPSKDNLKNNKYSIQIKKFLSKVIKISWPSFKDRWQRKMQQANLKKKHLLINQFKSK